MHVLLIVIGLLLAVFGGGCVLIMGVLVAGDLRSALNDLPTLFGFGGLLGLLPLAVGILLIRAGLRIDREKRKATIAPGGGQTP